MIKITIEAVGDDIHTSVECSDGEKTSEVLGIFEFGKQVYIQGKMDENEIAE